MRFFTCYCEDVEWIVEQILPNLPKENRISLERGECAKTFHALHRLLQNFVRLRVQKEDLIVAIGGGSTGDLVGFASNIWMRGIDFCFVPTTVMSICDSSIGGKNAINFSGYKNLLGTYRDSVETYIDLSFLITLSDEEYFSGFAELIKLAFIDHSNFFLNLLLYHKEALLRRVPSVSNEIFALARTLKSSFVRTCDDSNNRRDLLNYGHTFGHALEKFTNASHGRCVSLGMVYAAYLANQIGYLARDAVDLHLQLLRFFDLPVKLSELTDRKTTASELLSIMQLDKKSYHLVLLHGLHKAELVHIKKMKDEIVQLLEKQLG